MKEQDVIDGVRVANQINAKVPANPRAKQGEGGSSAKQSTTLEALRASFEGKSANQRNAAKSTGPKTAAGKRTVRLNALKHGLYSRELVVSDQDKPDFELLRKSIRMQLAPGTALQDIALEQVVACVWRSRLALRLEMSRLKAHLTTDSETNDTGPLRDVSQTQWYGASHADCRTGLGILKNLREEVSQYGLLRPEVWKDLLCKAFGGRFFDALTEWNPANLIAMQMAESVATHAKNFNLPLKLHEGKGQKIIADPRQQQQMQLKLIDQQTEHLRDFQACSAADSRVTAPIEFAPRYFATASRDLQRAVDWFQMLKVGGL